VVSKKRKKSQNSMNSARCRGPVGFGGGQQRAAQMAAFSCFLCALFSSFPLGLLLEGPFLPYSAD
jgi:hypothetical protein